MDTAAPDIYYPLGCGYTHAAFAVRKGNVPWPWQTQKPSARVGVSVWGRTARLGVAQDNAEGVQCRGCGAAMAHCPVCWSQEEDSRGDHVDAGALDQQLRNEPLLRPGLAWGMVMSPFPCLGLR